jgi:hypothetical protein
MAGAFLVAAGAFILFQHLDRSAGLLGSVSGIAGRTLGVVPAVVFAISRTLEAYGANPRVFLQDFVKQLAISFFPLVLVMLGAALSRSGAAQEGIAWSKKDCERVDPAAGRSTLK